jgi:hypothetical protein
MSDKELIKQEIERIEQILDDFNKTHNNTIDNGIVTAKKNICKHIKYFIDSISEESGCKKKDYRERYKRITQTEQFKKTYCDKSLGKEEPANEDLEEEIDRFEDWVNNFNQSDYPTSYTVRDIARHFAEWGRNHFEDKSEMVCEETTIVNDWQYGKDQDHAIIPAIHQRIEGFNVGDKVKLIIIKEEQQ